jgi:prolyl-tRNA editing enzyme YbaK/EbsC (Cys-tRNA(Pro) deacylase)
MESVINEEIKLKNYMKGHGINGEQLHFDKPIHTVEETIEVTGLPVSLVTKSMIFKDAEGKTVVGMVPAAFRVSLSKLEAATNMGGLQLVDFDEAYKRTGYPPGGMPCFGYSAVLAIDPLVTEKDYIYTGGGSEYSLLKIAVSEIVKIANPITGKRIRGNK